MGPVAVDATGPVVLERLWLFIVLDACELIAATLVAAGNRSLTGKTLE